MREATREQRLRRQARRAGYRLVKERGQRYEGAPWFIVDPDRNAVIVGEMTLDQAEAWLATDVIGR